MKIEVDIPDEFVALLQVIGDPESVLAELADHVQQGVSRPGSWERGWLIQAFGDEFTTKLKTDPSTQWREIPK
jgi:hypothetical protein